MVFSCKNSEDGTNSNIVNVRISAEPDLLNPILSTKAGSKQVERQLFMSLLQFDPETLELYPVLAKSRPQVESLSEGDFAGGQKYIFEIRPEAKWDDGVDITGNDFEFTLKAFLHPEIGHPGLRSFLAFIKKIEVDPDNPKRFTVFNNKKIILAEEVFGTMAVYPKHLYDPANVTGKYPFDVFVNPDSIADKVIQDASLSQFAIHFKNSGNSSTTKNVYSCGPYMLTEWIPGQRLILEKKEDWWANDIESSYPAFHNFPDQLVYHFIDENNTLLSLLKEEKIDVAADIDPESFDALKKSDPGQQFFNFFKPIAPAYYFIAINTKKPELQQKETRRALSHLLDIEQLIELAMNGYASPTVGPVLPVKPYYNKSLDPIDFDLEKAKELLNISGWRDNNRDGILEKVIDGVIKDFKINFKYTNNNSVAEKVGLLLKDNAIKAGIDIDLIPLNFDKLIADTRNRDFDLYFSQWSQMPGLDDLSNIWHTKNDTPMGFNKTGFGNAETDALITEINQESDAIKRKEMYLQIQEIIYEEQPYIFLFVPRQRIVIHKRFDANASVLRPGYFENSFRLR